MIQRFDVVGHIQPKASKDIKKSVLGLGFEKLDRDAFDPMTAMNMWQNRA